MESEEPSLPAVPCIVFHEKAFKLKMKFISFLVGCALGSGFHADSGVVVQV
jgi:hypothetical protein